MVHLSSLTSLTISTGVLPLALQQLMMYVASLDAVRTATKDHRATTGDVVHRLVPYLVSHHSMDQYRYGHKHIKTNYIAKGVHVI